MSPLGSSVVSWGAALPDQVLTNADFEAKLDTSNEWIVARTGIRERRVGGMVSEMATQAGTAALERAGLDPKDLDFLVLATTTPDQSVPATSSLVHRSLGLNCGAFDVNAACAGFVYALAVGHGLLSSGARHALVIGADALSHITDFTDRSTAVLFGDGAGAVVLEAGAQDRFLAWDLGVDSSGAELLACEHGGYLHMDGKEVFRRAVRTTVESVTKVLDEAQVKVDDVALFVPHQANARIIDASCNRLGLPSERVAMVIERTGNTSSASIPLALDHAANAGRLAEGDLVVMSAFGAGLTWATTLLRWGRG